MGFLIKIKRVKFLLQMGFFTFTKLQTILCFVLFSKNYIVCNSRDISRHHSIDISR